MRKNDYDVMNSTDKESAKLDMIEITCKNCGAVNSIKNNTASECEFCGSQLQVKKIEPISTLRNYEFINEEYLYGKPISYETKYYLENDIELTTVGMNFNTFISFLLSFVSAIIAIIMFFYNIYLVALFIGIDFIFIFYAIFNRKARFKSVLNKALIAYNSGAYEQCERYLNKAKAYNIEDKFIEIIECYLRKSRKTKSKYGYR